MINFVRFLVNLYQAHLRPFDFAFVFTSLSDTPERDVFPPFSSGYVCLFFELRSVYNATLCMFFPSIFRSYDGCRVVTLKL